jgi:hypothetical protein
LLVGFDAQRFAPLQFDKLRRSLRRNLRLLRVNDRSGHRQCHPVHAPAHEAGLINFTNCARSR